MMTELKNRGLKDILIACTDELTRMLEAVMTLCKILKNHRIFPNDESVMRVIYLGINNLSKKWTMPIRDWQRTLNYLTIEFEGRLPL